MQRQVLKGLQQLIRMVCVVLTVIEVSLQDTVKRFYFPLNSQSLEAKSLNKRKYTFAVSIKVGKSHQGKEQPNEILARYKNRGYAIEIHKLYSFAFGSVAAFSSSLA
jgi:hypothetical protein